MTTLTRLFDVLIKLVEWFFKPFNWVANKLEEHFTGRLGGIPQSLFVAGLLIVISSPVLVYTALLMLQLQSPYCYISFALWLGFIGFIILCEIYVSYAQGKRLIESLSKEFKWDVEKYTKEYFELIDRQHVKGKRKRK